MVLEEGVDEGFDISAGFGEGRDGREPAVDACGVGGTVAVGICISGGVDELCQGRVGSQFLTPRVRFGSRVVVSVGIPYAGTGLGDAGALLVAGMSGDALQCLLADGVGEGILFGGVDIEVDDDFQAFLGDAVVGVGHVGETADEGFDFRSPLSAVVKVVHGEAAHLFQIGGCVAAMRAADAFDDDDGHRVLGHFGFVFAVGTTFQFPVRFGFGLP